MTFSQMNTTNPLHIKKIARHQIDLVVNRSADGHARSFVVNSLNLDDHKLPERARIKLFAYSKRREQSVELGTITSPQYGVAHPFTIDSRNPFHFRLIVCEADRPNILASCEGLRATEETDEAGRQHLLPVEPSDNLQEKLWEIRFDGDGDPVLYVNSDTQIGMLARMRGDEIFQALILPQAVEQVLRRLSQHPDDDEGWQGKWNSYLLARGIEHPDDPDDEENCAEWARAVSQKFANENKFLTKTRKKIMETDYDS